ncbi:acyl-CoA thioesterase domain-containing protein [Gordonia crocea]|uniref:Thioesterase n=1 Tax=Gordonia crocea TaxID=589162 RepID=A0A7I9V1H7_9ACTN|nr:acyl-CoA thioesterase domain-containing protein [Gordonia crocea]GED99255.1 thioesterase [Gordonia crocea]
MASPSFFTEADGHFDPTRYALSMWAPRALNGPAVCALSARAAERAADAEGFRPARFTIDLFRAAMQDPTTTTATLLRDGGRVRVVEVDVHQYPNGLDAEPVRVARSTTVFLRGSSNPPGERWTRPAGNFTPPALPADDYYPRFAADAWTDAEGTSMPAVEWTREIGALQGAGRKRQWTYPLPVVPDEPASPFVGAVTAGESSSLLGNWGTTGIGLINCDLTVALTRLPHSARVGVVSDFHVEEDGVSVSQSILYDADGPIGTGMVTAVNNAKAEIDFTAVDPEERFRQA